VKVFHVLLYSIALRTIVHSHLDNTKCVSGLVQRVKKSKKEKMFIEPVTRQMPATVRCPLCVARYT